MSAISKSSECEDYPFTRLQELLAFGSRFDSSIVLKRMSVSSMQNGYLKDSKGNSGTTLGNTYTKSGNSSSSSRAIDNFGAGQKFSKGLQHQSQDEVFAHGIQPKSPFSRETNCCNITSDLNEPYAEHHKVFTLDMTKPSTSDRESELSLVETYSQMYDCFNSWKIPLTAPNGLNKIASGLSFDSALRELEKEKGRPVMIWTWRRTRGWFFRLCSSQTSEGHLSMKDLGGPRQTEIDLDLNENVFTRSSGRNVDCFRGQYMEMILIHISEVEVHIIDVEEKLETLRCAYRRSRFNTSKD